MKKMEIYMYFIQKNNYKLIFFISFHTKWVRFARKYKYVNFISRQVFRLTRLTIVKFSKFKFGTTIKEKLSAYAQT